MPGRDGRSPSPRRRYAGPGPKAAALSLPAEPADSCSEATFAPSWSTRSFEPVDTSRQFRIRGAVACPLSKFGDFGFQGGDFGLDTPRTPCRRRARPADRRVAAIRHPPARSALPERPPQAHASGRPMPRDRRAAKPPGCRSRAVLRSGARLAPSLSAEVGGDSVLVEGSGATGSSSGGRRRLPEASAIPGSGKCRLVRVRRPRRLAGSVSADGCRSSISVFSSGPLVERETSADSRSMVIGSRCVLECRVLGVLTNSASESAQARESGVDGQKR